MIWNWQRRDWPNFTYDKESIVSFENVMRYDSGVLFGAFHHLSEESKLHLKVDIISEEALKTSEIEGEYLNRDSLQSSILRQFGLKSDNRRVDPKEEAISELMLDLYRTYQEPLLHSYLHNWHAMLMGSRTDLRDIGCYRTAKDLMQIISGSIHDPKIHFEAPPSEKVVNEMNAFIDWFNNSKHLPILTRASIAHLYFESVHPFEDGNGRIGRAIVEKSLAQSMGYPSLIALATMIEKNKKSYYLAFERANKHNDVTEWIHYFSKVILDAQNYTKIRIEFLIKKAKFYEKYKMYFNERQEKVIDCIFRAGSEGFKGGLSAENYIRITNISRATATRDLQELVAYNALLRQGEKKHTRYYLNLG